MADTALVRSASRLAQVTGFTDEQILLIAQTVAKGATRLELAWFLYNARRLGLEPTLQQIHFIKYASNEPGAIVVGINGYRKQADDSGCYAGSDDAVFEYHDVGQPKGVPSQASVTVWKIVAGQRVPFTGSSRWLEDYPGDGPIGAQYRKRPHNQLAVRAESRALRKGFPYQTEKLEAHAEAPLAWREAALEDEQAKSDPRVVAYNAKRYDEIFGGEQGLPEPKPKHERAEIERLRGHAEELGVHVPGADELRPMNDQVLHEAIARVRADIKKAEDEVFAQAADNTQEELL